MTILLEDYGRLPTVVEGFANPLEFRFRLFHDESDEVAYEPLGSYDIAAYVVNPGTGRSFLGHCDLASSEPLLQLIPSRPDPNRSPMWIIHVDMSPEIIARINATRGLSNPYPVQFQFEWGLLARSCSQMPQGPQYHNPRRQPVMQRTEGGSRTPLISVPIQEWFKITEAYGFPQRRYVELVFPGVDRERWPQAVDDLAHADRDFDSRNDKQVMDYCEQAFENVFGKQAIMTGNCQQVQNAIAQQLEEWGVSDQSKREMLADLFASAVIFDRRGKHSANAVGHPQFDPDSGDAELALLVTKSVVGYLSKQRSR